MLVCLTDATTRVLLVITSTNGTLTLLRSAGRDPDFVGSRNARAQALGTGILAMFRPSTTCNLEAKNL